MENAANPSFASTALAAASTRSAPPRWLTSVNGTLDDTGSTALAQWPDDKRPRARPGPFSRAEDQRYLDPDIGIATSLIRCVCPLGSGTSPYTMYGVESSRYHVARSCLSLSRCSSTFHATTLVPSTLIGVLPLMVNTRHSAFVAVGDQTGAMITRPSLKPTAAGTRSDAPAKNPPRSSVMSTLWTVVSPGMTRVPFTLVPLIVSCDRAPLLLVEWYPYGCSVTAS